jgi:large subunit ribosomal protein L23
MNEKKLAVGAGVSHPEKLYHLLMGPHLSEKAYLGADKKMAQYVFRVKPQASKVEIKRAIEHLFSVEVASVKTLNVKGKEKMFKQRPGRRKDWKKAYVCLKQGFQIDYMGASEKG